MEVVDAATQALDGFLTAIDQSEARRIREHIQIATAGLAKQGGPTLDDLDAALADGWTPDYNFQTDGEFNWSGTLAKVTSTKLGANGALVLGLVNLGVTFEQGTQKQETSTISGTVRFQRVSRTEAGPVCLRGMQLQTLGAAPAPQQPAVPAAPTAPAVPAVTPAHAG